MTCDCIKKIEKEFTEKYKSKVYADSVLFGDGSLRFSIRAFYYETTKNGRKREKNVGVYPKYCPICGKPYNENEIKEE